MKTGRRNFIKGLGSLVGLLAVGRPAKVAAAPLSITKVEPLTARLCQTEDMTIEAVGKTTFILDMPNNEVRCKGFRRTSDGELKPVHMSSTCWERTYPDGEKTKALLTDVSPLSLSKVVWKRKG